MTTSCAPSSRRSFLAQVIATRTDIPCAVLAAGCPYGARQEPERAKNAVSFSEAQELLKLSIADLEDAIAVLGCGDLHPEAVMKLKEALAIDMIALGTSHKPTGNALIDQAIAGRVQARSMMRN